MAQLQPSILDVVGRISDFLNQQVEFFEKRKYGKIN